jgi:hypothetical protein
MKKPNFKNRLIAFFKYKREVFYVPDFKKYCLAPFLKNVQNRFTSHYCHKVSKTRSLIFVFLGI